MLVLVLDMLLIVRLVIDRLSFWLVVVLFAAVVVLVADLVEMELGPKMSVLLLDLVLV